MRSVAGSTGPMPETKTKSPARITGVYGPRGLGVPGGEMRSIMAQSFTGNAAEHRADTGQACPPRTPRVSHILLGIVIRYRIPVSYSGLRRRAGARRGLS